MSKYFLLLSLMLIQYSFCSEPYEAPLHSDEESFLQAAALYRQHAYDKALKLYASLDSPGAPVFYNMGNCYYHQKKNGLALVNWLRAQRTASYALASQIDHNIACLLADLNRSDERSFRSYGEFVQRYMYAYCAPLLLQLLLLLILMILIICVVKRIRSRWLIVLLLFIGLWDVAILRYSYQHNHAIKAVVIAPTVTVFAGPGEDYASVGSLQEADELTIGKTEDTWYKICHGNVAGWVQAHQVEII